MIVVQSYSEVFIMFGCFDTHHKKVHSVIVEKSDPVVATALDTVYAGDFAIVRVCECHCNVEQFKNKIGIPTSFRLSGKRKRKRIPINALPHIPSAVLSTTRGYVDGQYVIVDDYFGVLSPKWTVREEHKELVITLTKRIQHKRTWLKDLLPQTNTNEHGIHRYFRPVYNTNKN